MAEFKTQTSAVFLSARAIKLTRTFVVVFAVVLFASTQAQAQDQAQAQSASETAAETNFADGALSSTPWFDSDEGTLVPVTVKDRTDDSVNRQSRWLPKAKKVVVKAKKKTTVTTTTGGGGGGGTGNGVFGTNLTGGIIFGWILLVFLIAGVVGLMVYVFSKAEIELGGNRVDASKVSAQQPVDRQTMERMKQLPKEMRRTDVNLRTEAERLAGIGEYDQAIVLLFGHQLLMLDKSGSLRLTRGKTNGKYVREARQSNRQSGDRLRMTATAFERSFFGRHDITSEEFRALWDNNIKLENLIESQKVAA